MFKRTDGRELDSLRKVFITHPFNKFAEGSCLIEVGNTKVVCTATVDEQVPSFLKGAGSGWVTAEYGMLPRSCQQRIPRERARSSGRMQEIQRLVGRSLRAVVDLEALGERTIWIDCDVLQGDGGTRGASITGGFVALVLALCRLKDKSVFDKIPLKDFVAATSVGIFDGQMLLDLAFEEDSKAEVDMNLVMTGKGELVEIQGTAEGRPFSEAALEKLLALGKKGVQELIKIQRHSLKEIL